ncbi:MAG: molybdopterin-dependent oxidoreductase [Betaproteobacteria bacterium]
MDKRTFLQAACGIPALAALAPASAAPGRTASPLLLTVSGDIGKPNRGASDGALDQLMHKHGIAFRQARTFSFAELGAMAATTIRPTLEYDARRHTLRGPALTRVLEVAGAMKTDRHRVVLRALDGYAVELTLAETRSRGMIVATTLDGAPLPLGGLGPLWAICDADRLPELASRPLASRFAQCPWGVYSIQLLDPANS